MFGHLVIKEWKERWTLVAFGVVVLTGFAIACVAFADEREAPGILLGAMSLVFLPVFGALLGATGFEAEFRNGAWAYLLSRPVKRTAIWLAKFLALISILVFVGLLSFGLVSASAKLKAAASTLTAPGLGGANDPLISMLVVGFGLSLLTFALAFAMSLLTERAITVTAASLFLGFVIYGGWLYGFVALSELLLSRFRPALIWVGLILTGLVALFASLETFRKADFSQPRRKAGFFWRRAGIFFIPVLVGLAIAAVWPPGRGRWITPGCTDQGHVYFNTHKGSYVYFATEDRTEKLDLRVTGRDVHLASARGGRLAGIGLSGRRSALFIARTDGTDKVLVTGPNANDARLKDKNLSAYWGTILSPDGRAVAFSTWPQRSKSGETTPPMLWLVNEEGVVLKNKALVFPELSPREYFNVYLVGWPEGTNLVLFNLRCSSRDRKESDYYIMAWDVGQNELRSLVKDSILSFGYRKTVEKKVAFRSRSSDGKESRLSVLNLETALITDIWTEPHPGAELTSARFVTAWSPDGQKLAFVVERDGPAAAFGTLGIYGWREQEVIKQRELSLKEIRHCELNWTPDGRQVIVRNAGRNGLEFFAENLEPTRFVAFPRGENFYGLTAVGDRLLVEDSKLNRLWRLDLKTEQWKRVF
jgi:Tol biopolymer transport system component